ncbi:uncharacterized protein EI90DRAFT_3011184 [Cantharellus anzutake]|uniref:uncharacterized protein n=1 Tax=Cantharellus anzutake TaxID=1750568 RepID=UPI0019033F4D|nr:uncharacterized protein EI90DRAFT_3011184 [Cantharellus anzutake]KAF8342675.1 hypothetical protein EI90DRAFT_3011184 [Cantharellus anzutake]
MASCGSVVHVPRPFHNRCIPDVLFEIGSLLTPKSLRELSRTCRYAHEVLLPLRLRSIEVHQRLSGEQPFYQFIHSVIARGYGHHVRKFSLHFDQELCYDQAQLEFAMRGMPHLKHLGVEGYENQDAWDPLFAFLANNSGVFRLKSLRLSGMKAATPNVLSVLESQPGIEELMIDWMEDIVVPRQSLPGLRIVAARPRAMRSLIPGRPITHVASRYRHFQRGVEEPLMESTEFITHYWAYSVTTAELPQLLPGMPYVRSLTLILNRDCSFHSSPTSQLKDAWTYIKDMKCLEFCAIVVRGSYLRGLNFEQAIPTIPKTLRHIVVCFLYIYGPWVQLLREDGRDGWEYVEGYENRSDNIPMHNIDSHFWVSLIPTATIRTKMSSTFGVEC